MKVDTSPASEGKGVDLSRRWAGFPNLLLRLSQAQSSRLRSNTRRLHPGRKSHVNTDIFMFITSERWNNARLIHGKTWIRSIRRVLPEFMSLRRNWVPHPLPLQQVWPPRTQGGRHTRLRGRVNGTQFRQRDINSGTLITVIPLRLNKCPLEPL